MTLLPDRLTLAARNPSRKKARPWRRITGHVVLVVVLVNVRGAVSHAQQVHFTAEGKSLILERVTAVPASDHERASVIKQRFSEAGCRGDLLHEQPVEGVATPNIICDLSGQGENQDVVIVGSAYDLASSSRRIAGNWSGASLLPALYRCLRGQPRHHRFIFVAFADGGADPLGAALYAAQMNSSDLRHARAMVNLGTLGLSPTKVWTSHSNKDLVHDLVVMAYALKLPASQVDMENAGGTDADPFAGRQIPQITIHSLTRENLNAGATRFLSESYYDTYRLLCGYLAYLDLVLKPRPD